MILLSTAYFPPIQYFTKLVEADVVYIEQHEHFIKQTYRNRAMILAANGPIPLIVPVVKGRGPKVKMKDLKISYDEDWQRNHWRTIFSAYNSSPFFEYYADDIEPLLTKKYEFLLDLNTDILKCISNLIGIDTELVLTNDFEKTPTTVINLREKIHPKSHRTEEDEHFTPRPYTQVFSEKFEFVSNLSILDLLFNEGPQAYSVLQDCIRS